MAAFWPTKNAHDPLSRDVLARSLDGYRLAVRLTVRFRRALDDAIAEATADEVAGATNDVLGDQISQGRVPLTKEELGTAILKRVSSATNKVIELDVDAFEVLGGRQSGQQSARSHRPSVGSLPATSPSSARAPTPPTQASSPPTRISTPPTRVSTPSPRIPTPSARIPSTVPMPSTRAPTPSNPAAQLGERASGSSLAAPPRTLWLVALSQCAPGTPTDEIAKVLGLALRDSTAAALLRTLLMVDPVVVDRLALLDGRPPMTALRTEICACLAAGLCRALVADGLDGETASRLSERACADALVAAAPSKEHLRSYMSSDAPVRDLARRTANTIGAPNDSSAIHSVLSPYCEALRVQFTAVSRELKRLK